MEGDIMVRKTIGICNIWIVCKILWVKFYVCFFFFWAISFAIYHGVLTGDFLLLDVPFTTSDRGRSFAIIKHIFPAYRYNGKLIGNCLHISLCDKEKGSTSEIYTHKHPHLSARQCRTGLTLKTMSDEANTHRSKMKIRDRRKPCWYKQIICFTLFEYLVVAE